MVIPESSLLLALCRRALLSFLPIDGLRQVCHQVHFLTDTITATSASPLRIPKDAMGSLYMQNDLKWPKGENSELEGWFKKVKCSILTI